MSTIIILSSVIGALLLFIYHREVEHNRHIEAEHVERRDLLDRIQAPSFGEYTSKVVREKKAAQPDEPKVIDDYVS
ncbi:hypothetical protein NYE59_01655 [Paenibacillus sp. FSL L8-0323]|uniref:hypothetical protein n=1 Tax=Paenibacillus sp. FSL L8-0323 TaxID=2975330 RepID=UPI0030FBDD82